MCMYVHVYICAYMYRHMYPYMCTYICIYTCIYIKIRYVSPSTALDACLQIRHQDQTAPPRVNASPWCAQKVKECIITLAWWPPHTRMMTPNTHKMNVNLTYIYKECIITTSASPLTLYTGSICPFFSSPRICVCIILHIYTHAHTRMITPDTHKMNVNVYTYKHTDQKKKLNQKRATHKEREVTCVGGGRWK